DATQGPYAVAKARQVLRIQSCRWSGDRFAGEIFGLDKSARKLCKEIDRDTENSSAGSIRATEHATTRCRSSDTGSLIRRRVGLLFCRGRRILARAVLRRLGALDARLPWHKSCGI